MSIKKPKAFWPVVIGSGNNKIYYNYTSGSNGIGTIASGTYYSAALLAAAVQTAITTGTNPLTTAVVTVDATGHFVVADIAEFTMRWGTTTNSIYVVLGEVAVNKLSSLVGTPGSAGAYTCTSTYQHQNGWYSPVAVVADSLPQRMKDMDTVTKAVGGQTKFISEVENSTRKVLFQWLPPEKFLISYATAPYVNQALEQWWQDGYARFRYWEDGATEGTYADYVFAQETLQKWAPTRQYTRKALYQIELSFLAYV